MPRRKQIRPTRMKHSEDGKVIKEEDDDDVDRDGSSEDDDEEESDGEDTQQSDDDNVASDNELKTTEENSEVALQNSEEELRLKTEISKEKVDDFEESVPVDEIDALENKTKDIENFDKDMLDSDVNNSDIWTTSDNSMNMLVTATPGGEVAQPVKRKCSFEMGRCTDRDLLRNNYRCSNESVMDLSAKRPKLEHSTSEVSQSSHKPNTYRSSSRNSSVDPSQPLDLSQKSSRKSTPERKGSMTSSATPRNSHHEPRNLQSGSRSPYHNSRNKSRESRNSYQDSRHSHREQDSHDTAISPSLASLQQKFGSNLGYWYNGGYPQFPHMNYVFSHLKIPSQYDVMQYDKRSLEGWYGKIMPSIAHPVSRQTQILKPVLPAATPRPVSNASGVRRSPSSVTSTASSSRPSASLPIPKPPMDIPIFTDTKTALKGNCTDYKCDCSKAYSSLYELSVHMQDTGHMPRNTKIGPSGDYPKLVRGQDMWLNSGSEQTKQILRCMQCGESFKSLPELTVHMMKTQHYADIFSSAHRKLHKCTTFFEKENDTKSVFKCRVCDTEYDSLDGLANHMVESKHHKKQGWRFQNSPNGSSARPKVETSDNTDGLHRKLIKKEHISKEGSPKPVTNIKREIIDNDLLGENRPTTGEDVKCLNKLLFDADKNGDINHNDTSSEISDDEVGNLLKPCKEEVKDAIIKDFIASGQSTPSDLDEDMGTIRCENCLVRIHTDEFVEHVRVCISKKSQSEVIGKLKAKLTARSRSCSDVDDDCLSDNEDEKVKSQNDEKPSINGIHDVVNYLPKSLGESKETSPLLGKLPKLNQESGSALKAMEHFIDNFNEKRLTKSRHGMKARSLLYNVPNVCNYPSISPLVGNNNYVDSSRLIDHEAKSSLKNEERTKSGSDTEDRGRSPRGMSSPSAQTFSPKYERMIENDNGGSALHSLYKFASMDPRKVAPKLRAKLDQKPHLLQTGSDNPIKHSPQPIRLSPTQTKHIETNVTSKQMERSRDTPEKTKNLHSPVREMDRNVSRDSDGARQDLIGETDRDHLPDTPSPGSGKNQYLHVEAESPLDSKSNGSALDSLKGLVVKHMEKGEHPLNSLQKLINSTDGNHGPTITSLQSKLVQNGPVWYSMSNSVFSPRKLHSPHSRSGSPVLERGAGGPGAMDLTLGANTNSDHGSHSSDSDEEAKPSDLKCDLCGKVFSSKGGCRYHRSKCPQNVPRGMGGREARIVRTPYMYMPPEHTNKFSKYYEMARELANKSK